MSERSQYTQPGKALQIQLNEALRQELLDMAARDQEMRDKYSPGMTLDPDDIARLSSVDSANTARMKEIVAQYEWPGKSLVGEDGAKAAWLLVQHADQDPDFQKQCLALLQAAVAAGEAEAQDLAYLTDRVCMHEGKPQWYGTQLHRVDDEIVPLEIEDPEHVDERRAAVGLPPLTEYIATIKRLSQ